MADRGALLARLERLRAVERHEALARLAARQAEQQRMEEVARRSRALAGDGAVGPGPVVAADLRAGLAFRARLTGLIADAERLGSAASAAESTARSLFVEADRRLDRVRDQRLAEQAKIETAKLARALLGDSRKQRRTD